ncbi:hypothetical protein DW66_3022 [Pseudomonas putida]|nr:hypothetical protein DW66_3022 [Pseudomonas putida]AJG13423.1 hypothetical protein RK21_01915 [Pseudomonas plecoglossicida]
MESVVHMQISASPRSLWERVYPRMRPTRQNRCTCRPLRG